MWWPFSKKQSVSIRVNTVEMINGRAIIDVRGQTCPGYLLAINKAVETLASGTTAELLITYPPCGEDVHAWCREKGIEFIGLAEQTDKWVIEIKK